MGEIIFISEIWVEVKMEGCSLFYIFKRMLENMIFFSIFINRNGNGNGGCRVAPDTWSQRIGFVFGCSRNLN